MSLRSVCSIVSISGSLFTVVLLLGAVLVLPHTVHSVIGGFVGFGAVWVCLAAHSDGSPSLLAPPRFKMEIGL